MSENYIAPRFTEEDIVSVVERVLPEFAKACVSEGENIVLTQSAFAGDYLMGEFTILAFAIKYAGIKGKIVTIIS